MDIGIWVLPIVLLVVFEAIADILAKEWQLHGGWIRSVGAMTAYLVANSFWLFALKNGAGLARGGLIFAVSCALLAVFIGWWMYKEEITRVQATGIALGLASLCLIFWEE